MKTKVKSAKGGEKSPTQWFVECDPFSNESVERALSECGISDAESKFVGISGSDGKKHDVVMIPPEFVKKLRAAKRGDRRFRFRFFKRNGPEGVIYPADFLERKRKSKRLLEAAKRLGEMKTEKKR